MAAPTITSISPTSGPASGGTVVTILGNGFDNVTSVLFGATVATGISVQGSGVVVATSPPGSGVANIGVVTQSGTSPVSLASQFAYAAAPAPAPTNPGVFTDPALTSTLASNLVNALIAGTTPTDLEAKRIIDRRIALEGDVVGSRLAPPNTITAMAGWFNLLGTMQETAMQEQMLAGLLGVAGPQNALGFTPAGPPLAMVAINNDRPDGFAQATLPLQVLVRSDMVTAVQAAIAAVHTAGAALPLIGPTLVQLPAGGTGATPPADPLPYLGRVLQLAPAAALVDPMTDPLLLLRASGSSDPYTVAARVTATGSTIAAANYDVLAGDPPTSQTIGPVQAVPLGPVLQAAGFYPVSPLPTPTTRTDTTWTRFTNTTGLIAGSTTLGSELGLLYDSGTIAASAFAAAVGTVWNGTAFATAT